MSEPPLEEEAYQQQQVKTDQDCNDPEGGGDPVNTFAEDMMSMHSTDGMDRRGTLVGTMNYLTPEMIQS